VNRYPAANFVGSGLVVMATFVRKQKIRHLTTSFLKNPHLSTLACYTLGV
jgi:hypothetical protein